MTETMRRPPTALLALLFAIAATAGCGKSDGNSSGTNAAGEPAGELLVFAAASLTDAFTALADDFEKAHPEVEVKMSFAGSQSLRTQIQNGAEPQLFASANPKHMDLLRDANLVGEPVVFAHNELVIVVPASNPANISSLAELPNAGRIVLAGKNVPAGSYAAKMLANASSSLGSDFADRVDAKVVSRENHVRQTLQKVVLGEADAAIVYATDAASAGDKVQTIEIPAEHNVVASYPIAVVSDAPRNNLGKLFIEFVLSDAGRAKLKAYGFRPPER